ncbi:MAG: sensor histidine kinase [Pseudomonadota bacterium]|nr:sensor histidine kinase [Pseudomonadota bacterium]
MMRAAFPVSRLTLRILAVNMIALVLLAGGVLYLERYQDQLVRAERQALLNQARIVAAALAEGTVVRGPAERSEIDLDLARPMIRRLVEETDARTRLFLEDGTLAVDSRIIGEGIEVEPLPPPETRRPMNAFYRELGDVLDFLPGTRRSFPLFQESLLHDIHRNPDLRRALDGEPGASVWKLRENGLMVTVAVPVQRYKKVLGAVLLSRDGRSIARALGAVRQDILKVSLGALALTTLLSLYLGRAIVRPIRGLAHAADSVRHGLSRQQTIPDYTARRDEIGDLSRSLREMTGALWDRMDAIEQFAADVAHELKNPLCSLRSAVETVGRVRDPARQEKLLEIIGHDVRRMDRLISDISSASRLDAELSRAQFAPVDMGDLLSALVDIHQGTGEEEKVPVTLDIPKRPLKVTGMESRLMQVFRNLLQNAVSFSPPGGGVRISGRLSAGMAEITVEDDGPGIIPGKEEAIFERFYTERPAGEEFGSHSGLGLSISRQIVGAHGGTIQARNRTGPDGQVKGAVFTVRIPDPACGPRSG